MNTKDKNWPGLCTSSENHYVMLTVCPTSVHSSSTDPKLYFMLHLWIQTPEGRRMKWLWATSTFLSAGLPEGGSSIPGDSDRSGKYNGSSCWPYQNAALNLPSATWTLNWPSHPTSGVSLCKGLQISLGKIIDAYGPSFFTVQTSLPDPASRTGTFFICLCNSNFLPGLNMPVKHRGFCLQMGYGHKSLPAATGLYSFSLFQVLAMLKFLLNFIRFLSAFRKIPYCSRWGGVCTTSVVREQVHFASFPPKTTHCNTLFFLLRLRKGTCYEYSFPLSS